MISDLYGVKHIAYDDMHDDRCQTLRVLAIAVSNLVSVLLNSSSLTTSSLLWSNSCTGQQMCVGLVLAGWRLSLQIFNDTSAWPQCARLRTSEKCQLWPTSDSEIVAHRSHELMSTMAPGTADLSSKAHRCSVGLAPFCCLLRMVVDDVRQLRG